MVERRPVKAFVTGSSPVPGANFRGLIALFCLTYLNNGCMIWIVI